MRRKLLEGFVFGIGFLISIFLILGLVFAVGFHTTSEIIPGIFQGDYTFNGSVNFTNDISTNSLIVNNFNLSPETSKTITISNSMSVEVVQSYIDNLSKYIPYGQTIIFQFQDGTYNFNNTLYISGFYGGGRLEIRGNGTQAGANSAHTTQNVHIDNSGSSNSGIIAQFNDILIVIQNMRITVNTVSAGYYPVYGQYNSKVLYVMYSYLSGTSTSNSYGVLCNYGGSVYLQDNYFNNIYHGISAYHNCLIESINNYHTGTTPQYGLRAEYGGVIGKIGTQPSGSIGAQYSANGGEIR